MKPALRQSRRFEFGFPYLDTLVQVEERADGVEIRATRDTFSERRKAAFVRELAAEGFIDDRYRWFTGESGESYFGVRWSVDHSWLELPAVVIARARRFMWALQVGGFVTWSLLLVCFLGTGR